MFVNYKNNFCRFPNFTWQYKILGIVKQNYKTKI